MDEREIREELLNAQPITVDDEEARVVTQCLYPTNTMVRVTIREGRFRFTVSDGGGAIREISSLGLMFPRADYAMKTIAQKYGIRVENGVFFSPPVAKEEIGAAVALVANASRDAAERYFAFSKSRPSRNFKRLVAELLQRNFGEELKPYFHVVGNSTKQHAFDYAITRKERIILLDSVLRDPPSINSRVVANLDVKANQDPKYVQFIVYDDQEQWPSSDLSLLGMGATPLPFSRMEKASLDWRAFV